MSETPHRAFPAIFHPTDFSPASNVAFEHALALALGNRSTFSILHAETRKADAPSWSEFPHVRETLERWEKLPKGSPQSAVGNKLGVHAKKIERDSKDPSGSIAGFLEHNPADLIVLATEGREGLPRWINPSFSESLARRSRVPTLFLPKGTRRFVAELTGHVTLKRVLIPVDHRPNPQFAIDAAGGLMASLGVEDATIEALHINDQDRMPPIIPPAQAGLTFERRIQDGGAVDVILDRAADSQADMIVMATEGRHGFLDALRGSTTEQVLRRAPCPVFAIPSIAN